MPSKGQSKSQPPPTEKTYEQVFAQLVKNLCEVANKTLDEPIQLPSQPTLSDLENIFKQITLAKFKDTYNYDFAAGTTGLQQTKGTLLKFFDHFYDLEDENKPPAPPPADNNTTTQATQDPDPGPTPIPDDRQSLQTILDDFRERLAGLPEWVQEKAQNEGVRYLGIVFGSGTMPNTWTTNPLSPTYDQTEKYADSVLLNSVFVKVYGSLEDTGVKAEVNAVYCLGAYYQVKSAAWVAERKLWKSLYEDARDLLTSPPPEAEVPSKGDLEIVLTQYRDILFPRDHQFPFNGTPDNLVDDLGRPVHLFIIQDDDFSTLSQQVDQSIFSNLNLPSWSIDIVKSDVEKQIELLLRGPSPDAETNGWTSTKYDQTPGPPPTIDTPALNIKGDFIHCISISPTRRDVRYRGLYFCGVFYTTPSAKETLTKDLISTVYRGAMTLVENPDPAPSDPTRDDLDKLLLDALNYQFKYAYGFDYKGKDTTPGDKVGDVIYFAKVGTDVPGNDDPAAETVVDTIISSLNFPTWDDEAALRNSIHEDFIKSVKRCLAGDTQPPNAWGVLEHKPQYSYKDTTRNLIISKGVLVFCNGSASGGGQTLKTNFIYFAGVFYEIEDPWG
ncbi:hypothetical protein P691DRAFT_779483 [Macrolepiota fuliginosa MF-IS2]|uniref:Uncharacterized protein n=1 Tax=Macrolepiota fuliginosa MF-IS2 TaxID=1400762 RepID=A0A9P6BVX2_9AGAR|nr:hypothetical protein P691DRAFT_779483 [Macrolepiota fuliginosa MF-IS2]